MSSRVEDQDGPLQRWQKLGLRGLTASDLLALIAATTPSEAEEKLALATRLLGARGINALADMAPADLAELGEKDPDVCLRILAAIELGRRTGASNKGVFQEIRKPKDVVAQFLYLADEPQEHFCALFLSTKNGIIGRRTIHIGTVNASLVGPREVFREAVRMGAAAVIVAHNHPSGDPEPSPEDLEVTRLLKSAGELMDIPLLDHVIIGHNRHVSLKERKQI